MARTLVTDDRYRELFAEQERMGLSYDELAERAGVKASTLRWKKSALKRKARGTSADATIAPTLLPVRVRPAAGGFALEEGSTSPYEVRLNSGRALRVPRGFEIREVHALVCVLEGVSC